MCKLLSLLMLLEGRQEDRAFCAPNLTQSSFEFRASSPPRVSAASEKQESKTGATREGFLLCLWPISVLFRYLESHLRLDYFTTAEKLARTPFCPSTAAALFALVFSDAEIRFSLMLFLRKRAASVVSSLFLFFFFLFCFPRHSQLSVLIKPYTN